MALEVALAAERSATRFCRRLAESTNDAQLKAVYEEFVAFETCHSDWLERKEAAARRAAGSTRRA